MCSCVFYSTVSLAEVERDVLRSRVIWPRNLANIGEAESSCAEDEVVPSGVAVISATKEDAVSIFPTFIFLFHFYFPNSKLSDCCLSFLCCRGKLPQRGDKTKFHNSRTYFLATNILHGQRRTQLDR